MPNTKNEWVTVPWLGDGPTFTGWFLTWTERLTWRERFHALDHWHFREFFSGKRPAYHWIAARLPAKHPVPPFIIRATFSVGSPGE